MEKIFSVDQLFTDCCNDVGWHSIPDLLDLLVPSANEYVIFWESLDSPQFFNGHCSDIMFTFYFERNIQPRLKTIGTKDGF